MANSKKQFVSMYEQTVQLLKKFKQTNDSINKIIGIQHDSSVSLRIRRQKLQHNEMIEKIDKLLSKLQQSYLDPDTARKIGTIKQQYKIQKDRRQHLINSLSQQNDSDKKMPHQNSESQTYIKYTLANSKQYETNSKYSKNRKTQEDSQSNTTSNTTHGKYQQEITEYDYQIERKLILQKNNAIKQAETKLLNVYQISKQCEQMVKFQGQHLDIISDQIFKTKQNTTHAVKQLKQANQISKKRRRKIFTISIFMIIAIVAVLGITLF